MYEPSPQPTSWTRLLVPVSEHIWPSVAHLLVFSLVYDKSTVRMITGETLTIDGGQRFWRLPRDVQFLEPDQR